MSKKNPVISKCPICQHDLIVSTLHCESCETDLNGHFTLSKFNYLDTEKLYFIEVFMKNRGNIKAVEKELNISYPTVKKILDEVVVALGYKVDDVQEQCEEEKKEEKKPRSRIEILDDLNEGKITADEAADLLSGKTININKKKIEDITSKVEEATSKLTEAFANLDFKFSNDKESEE